MEPTSFDIVFLLVGLILMLTALSRPMIGKGPLTSSMFYLAVGWLLSPHGLGYLTIDPMQSAPLLERVSELAVVISLFVCGMHLQAHWRDKIWRVPLRLAFLSMTLTVALVALVAWLAFDWPPGVCLILGAVLAPTDPVLASDVRVEGSHDRDSVRFSLTGEGSLNDGSAFPFLYLGLGLMGYHHLSPWWGSWWTLDVLWGVVGGMAIGAILGWASARLVERVEKDQRQGVHEFLAFGLVFTAYGAACALNTHGFLAAFTAGLALRWAEDTVSEEGGAVSTGVIGFKERIERLLEAVTVTLVGALLFSHTWDLNVVWFAPLLFLVLRPVAVVLGLLGEGTIERHHKGYLAWFGIRGIGSVYYMSYAIEAGLPFQYAQQMSSLLYPLLGCSILVHGLSVRPLMERYAKSRGDGEGPPVTGSPPAPEGQSGS